MTGHIQKSISVLQSRVKRRKSKIAHFWMVYQGIAHYCIDKDVARHQANTLGTLQREDKRILAILTNVERVYVRAFMDGYLACREDSHEN